ncbi:hypothetical protein CSA57_04525 [candidate division KSB3 bacterium]|nr:MAG: hypothetical protein CSA57_04525 [candidate division KSB3 bacterium]
MSREKIKKAVFSRLSSGALALKRTSTAYFPLQKSAAAQRDFFWNSARHFLTERNYRSNDPWIFLLTSDFTPVLLNNVNTFVVPATGRPQWIQNCPRFHVGSSEIQ